MIEDMLGTNGAKFIVASLVVALALLCLVGVFWLIRNRPSSPFIRGGKNRQPRLAVLDAAAVDTRRRLVLVRRDDVEHLIMIGGPTDIVIESRIAPQRQAAAVAPEPVLPQQMPERRAVQTQPQTRPMPETKAAAPVSAMANVLYGEASEKAEQPRKAAMPAQSSIPRGDAAALPRPIAADRLSSQAVASREPSAGVAAAATLFPASNAPEDILEAARGRVLAVSGNAGPMQTRPAQTPPVGVAQQSPEKPAADFESFLDAEISGDLQKLTPESVSRPDPGVRTGVNARQEPKLDGPAVRQEPSLEEEMNRMLGEIASNRKP